jgi:ribosomal-protein-alanine N-acetyltransferase
VSLLVPLHTRRLRLEPLRPDHADALYEGLRDPGLYAYEADDHLPPRSRAALRRRFADLARARSPDGEQHWLNWALVLRAGGLAAGTVQATVDADLEYGSVAYTVLAAHQRRGLGSEATGAMVAHLLACGVRLLHAVIDVRNEASIRLVEGLGFARRETRRSDDLIGGVRGYDHDYVLHAPRAGAVRVPNSTA